jgi:hypothetical protein
MNLILLEFYLLIAIISMMIAYAGFEGTMRVFTYLDLQIRYQYIMFITWRIKRKLKRQLDMDTKHILKSLENAKKSNEKD